MDSGKRASTNTQEFDIFPFIILVPTATDYQDYPVIAASCVSWNDQRRIFLLTCKGDSHSQKELTTQSVCYRVTNELVKLRQYPTKYPVRGGVNASVSCLNGCDTN